MSPRPVCIPVGAAMGAACDVSYRAAQISVATANAQTVLRMIFPSYFTHPLLGEGRHGSIITQSGAGALRRSGMRGFENNHTESRSSLGGSPKRKEPRLDVEALKPSVS